MGYGPILRSNGTGPPPRELCLFFGISAAESLGAGFRRGPGPRLPIGHETCLPPTPRVSCRTR